YIAKNWIAIIALILSYLNYRKNNLGIYLDPEDKTDWLLAILLDDGKSIINEYGMLKLNLRIINPSNTDTSFFDLVVFDKKRPHQIYFKIQNNIYNDLEGTNTISAIKANNDLVQINIPENSYGTLKAHSITVFDIIIMPEDIEDKIMISFKTTNRKKIFSRNHNRHIKSDYQTFLATYPVKLSDKPDYDYK
ncbi:TPA: hypothetical protein ACQNCG_001683, partial [Streptococcus pyogenes]